MEVAQPSTFMLSSSLRSLSSDYLGLLDCGADRFADIAFCIDGRTDALVYAHRCILSARSPFFRLIFSPSSTSSASASSSSSSSSSESQSCDSPPSSSSSFRRPQSHSPPAASRNPYSGSISVSQCYPNQQLPNLQCQNQIVSSSTAGSSPASNSPTGILSSWDAGAAQIHGDIDVIPVDIVSYDAFVALLRFLYTGQLIIDPSAAEILGPALPLHYNLPSATANPMTYNVNYNYSVVHYGIHICLELIHAANFFGVDELSTLAQAKLGLVLQINDGANHASNHSISLEDIASVLIVARKHKLNRLWLSATELLVAQRDPGASIASTNDYYYYYYYYYELLQKYLPRDVLSELISSIEMLRQNHGLMNFSNGVVGGARISSNLLNCNGPDTYYNYAYNDHHINNNVMVLNSNVMQTDLNHDQYLYNKNNDNNNNNNVMGSNNYILGSSCNNNSSLMGSQNPLNSTNMTSNRYCNRGSHEAEAAMAMAMAETSEMMRLKQALECMDMEMVRMMAMGEGVDLNAAEALHYAVMRCSREVVKALLEMQGLVDVNHRIARRAPPSSSCSSSSSPPSGGLGSGPGPVVGDDYMTEGKQHLGMSALHLAAMMGSADMIAVLLDHHADPTATTDDGLSPLDILRSHIQPQPQPQPTGSAHYAHANAPNPFGPPDNNTKASRATAPTPGHHELVIPPRTTTANPVLSKSEHKRILLCIELIQSAAAVAEREDHEHLRADNEDDDDAEAEPAHSPISSTVTSVHHHHHHHNHHAQNMANHGHLMIHDHQVALNAHQEDLMSITFSTTSNDVGINKGCVSTTSGGISYVDHHHHHHNHLPTLTGSSS